MPLRTGLAVLLSGLLPAAPAAAKIAGRPDTCFVPTPDPFLGDERLPGPGLGADVRQIVRVINRASDRGLLTRREARQLRREARQIGVQGYFMGRDGLSTSEAAALAPRTQALRSIVTRPARTPTGRAGF